MSHSLSKSRYTLFHQCAKALWLRINKPEEAMVDASTQAAFERGNEVGDLAMQRFGDFVEVTTLKPDGGLDLKAMIDKTNEEMRKGTPVICEASFSINGHYCAVDILRRTNGGWAIYEVKSSSFSLTDGDPRDLEKYIPDIAYQKWVLTQNGINVTGTYLVCLNKDYMRHGDLDLQKLFVEVDLGPMIAEEYALVPTLAAEAVKVVNSTDEPEQDLWKNCHKPYDCAFWNYCKRLHGIPENEPTVFDLYRANFDVQLKHYRVGRIRFAELLHEKLTDAQRRQVECTLQQKELIDPDGIRTFLNKLTFPLYFLDFETMQDAVPQHEGTKPYQQIPFQYSLHIRPNRDNDNYEHREFLAPSDGSDPRRTLAEQLCCDIPMDVCTLAYNKGFECGRINELAILFPDLAKHLHNIANHIVDLIEPFREGYYYVPAMGGSFSIKSVLPALFPDDPRLNYHNLSELCQNGGDAMTIFPRIKDMSPDETAAAREALLRYCELDTWAMVVIWERLLEVAKK